MNSLLLSVRKHPSFSPSISVRGSQNLKISKNLSLPYKSNTYDL